MSDTTIRCGTHPGGFIAPGTSSCSTKNDDRDCTVGFIMMDEGRLDIGIAGRKDVHVFTETSETVAYTPQPGDKIRLDGWDQGSFVHVEAVGGPFIFGRTNHDTWGTWSRDYDWLKVPEPAATARIAISSRTGTSLHVPPGNEGRGYPSDIIVADVEIWPDGTVTGHTTEKDEP